MEKYFCDKCGIEKKGNLVAITLSGENSALSIPVRINTCVVCAFDIKDYINSYLKKFKFPPQKLL